MCKLQTFKLAITKKTNGPLYWFGISSNSDSVLLLCLSLEYIRTWFPFCASFTSPKRLAVVLDTTSNAPTTLAYDNQCSCSTDETLAPFEPRKCERVSHAKWRTVVLYGQSNIVLGCLHCTWWYGANRGICQMQSGVMEGRDRAGGIENEVGGGEWECVCVWGGGGEQLEPCQTLFGASAVRGQRPKAWASTTPWRQLCSESIAYNEPKSQMRSFINHTIGWGFLNCGWFVHTEMLFSESVRLKYTNLLKYHEVRF